MGSAIVSRLSEYMNFGLILHRGWWRCVATLCYVSRVRAPIQPSLYSTYTVDGAIHAAAGRALLEECK